MQGFGESELFAGVGEEALLELGEPARTVTVPKGKPLYLPSDYLPAAAARATRSSNSYEASKGELRRCVNFFA